MSYGGGQPPRGPALDRNRPDREGYRHNRPHYDRDRDYAGPSSSYNQARYHDARDYSNGRRDGPLDYHGGSSHYRSDYRSLQHDDRSSYRSGPSHSSSDRESSRKQTRYDDIDTRGSSPRSIDEARSRRRQGLESDDEIRQRKIPQKSHQTGWSDESRRSPRHLSSDRKDGGSSHSRAADTIASEKHKSDEIEEGEEEEDGEVRQDESNEDRVTSIRSQSRSQKHKADEPQSIATMSAHAEQSDKSQDGQRTREIRHSQPATEKRAETSKVRYDEVETERAATIPQWTAEPWEDDEGTEKERRVRKRNRPAQTPLRARTFYGCSPIEQYNLGVKLGQGTFGEVKKATHSLTGIEVALKKVTIHEEQDGMPITAIREIKLLKRLSHPAIVAVIDMAYRAPTERGRMGEVFMVEPYMDHDLNGMLENPSIQFTPAQIKLYMKQLLEGTLYLHQNNILHRDMKAANLLINNRGQLQIADFGLARPYHDPGRAWEANGWKGGQQGYTSMVVTRWYRPPELLAGDRRYGPPVDMWGLGCILAEMLLEKPLFQGNTEIDQLDKISKLCGSPNEESYPGWTSLPGVKNAEPDGRPDPEPKKSGQHEFGPYPRRVVEHFTNAENGGISVRQELADLLDKLLVLDPCRRMTAKEALEHEWFWQPPYPADPEALPTYQASKELDRQKRDHLKKQQQQEQNRLAAQTQAQMYPQHNQHATMGQSYGGTYNKRPPMMNGHMNTMSGQYGNRAVPTGPASHFPGSNPRPMPKMQPHSVRPMRYSQHGNSNGSRPPNPSSNYEY